ncbi:hypothetical protein DUNSADRAFT_9267 [Dunaliella salina]|uniref:Secreted protein n=1 Tax=Dunaliella salina TaxID=3046 RepID=A0ABQ7GHR9_DUNSA|nr:hypothetical protein DUNSADRAFT_9267 [Dunaliella salina]|eukprot:KAF5834148.1 hypothetical protein DUNSADRAFT_9267 [Dunaliella salina]
MQVCLGPTQTSDFALHLLRLIAAQVRTASMPTACELPTLAFWWSNLTHLRALLLLPKVAMGMRDMLLVHCFEMCTC